MTIDFAQRYGGQRLTSYPPQPPLFEAPEEGGDDDEDVPGRVLDYEVAADEWTARPVLAPPGWEPSKWIERPRRFVDGKDVGETVAWLRAPGGYPIPVRLSEIGGVVVRFNDGLCRRESAVVERVVSLVVDPFPWDEVESFAGALQENGFRLLPAEKPDGRLSYDFEKMRKASQNRSNTEMGVMEEAVLAQANDIPTIVDGRLEPRAGGLDPRHSPVAGVVKSHYKNYLHPRGLQLLYDLAPGDRTPVFLLEKEKLPVASWYLRLSGAAGAMPNWGVVRIEVALRRFLDLGVTASLEYVDRLSIALRELRCRESSYGRAPVSLHPIVRAEELLGALFSPVSMLASRFCRSAGL